MLQGEHDTPLSPNTALLLEKDLLNGIPAHGRDDGIGDL